MKRLFNLISVIMILFSCALIANAEENRFYLGSAVNAGKDTGYSKSMEIDKDDASEITSCASVDLEDSYLFGKSIYDCLANGMRNMESKIDISGYGISKNNLNTLNTYFGDTLLMNHDLYYVSPNYTYWYNGKGIITAVSPEYLVTDTNEIATVQGKIETTIDEIISHTNDSMNDIEKLMTIHDRMILSSCYDYSYQMTTAKELLLDGKAVCSGYTSALYAVATELGIPCGFVRSQEMNHVWNSVYIDGAWFHVDMTWNDPAKEHSTTVSHEYFLKSNAWMANEGTHYGFVYISNDSTKYDNAFWHNADSQIISLGNNNMYFIDDGTYYGSVSCYNLNTKEVSLIYTYDSLWPTGASSRYWLGAFSGLDVYDNRLYFNTWNEILSCEPDGTDIEVVFTAPESADTSIFGCRVEGRRLYYVVGSKADPCSVAAQYCIDLPEIKKPESLVITSHENSMRVSDPMGIRYKASLEKESGATSFGWIVTRESLLKEAGIAVSDFEINSNVLKAVGYNYGYDITKPKILESDDNYNYFTMVLYLSDDEADGYPSVFKLTEKFIARPFAEIDGKMVYGEASEPVSLYDVALEIYEDAAVYKVLNDKAKQYISGIVEKVESQILQKE